MNRPREVEVVSYAVGFGDCFLVRLHYDSGRPHSMLVDFGSTHKGRFTLAQVAKQIEKDCPDGLDVVVATHRHKDHVHGFARTESGGGTGRTIRDLAPSVVIQPWTEDPKAARDAVRPTRKYGSQGPAFVARLASMQSVAGDVARFARSLRLGGETTLRRSLVDLGENNLGNEAAVKNLRSMGRRHYYAYHGMKLGLSRELPGATLHVLGPPTLEQTRTIESQRSSDEDEFWHLQARAGAVLAAAQPPFPLHETVENDPVWARWARRRFRRARAEQLLAIVRSLDHAMNNTSLILLLEVGGRRLLFPGDAQLENWQYALGQAWVRKLLADVDLLKVGHHGSLNATPRSMLALLRKTRSALGEGAEPLHSLLSTKPGVHGDAARRTEVPRQTLVDTLRRETRFQSTEEFGAAEISRSVTLPVG